MINMIGVVVKKRLIRLIEDYFVLETLVDMYNDTGFNSCIVESRTRMMKRVLTGIKQRILVSRNSWLIINIKSWYILLMFISYVRDLSVRLEVPRVGSHRNTSSLTAASSYSELNYGAIYFGKTHSHDYCIPL